MKIGDISTSALFSTKNGNIGLFLVGVYFCLISLLLTGAIDYPNTILGLTFIAISIVNAKAKPLVLSGVLVGFLGLVNLLSIANVLPIETAWLTTAVCAVGVLIMEYGMKFGKSSAKAKVAIVIPMMSLFFMFILALIGYNPVLYVDWAAQPLKAVNYVSLMFLTGLLSFDMLGWRLAKKNFGMWVTLLAIICVATAFIGSYQALGWY